MTGKIIRWSAPHARDLTLLAALYDQSTAETFLRDGENFDGELVMALFWTLANLIRLASTSLLWRHSSLASRQRIWIGCHSGGHGWFWLEPGCLGYGEGASAGGKHSVLFEACERETEQ